MYVGAAARRAGRAGPHLRKACTSDCSRGYQRLRPDRPQLLPRRAGLRRRHRGRRGQRPHRQRDPRPPAEVRLDPRPARPATCRSRTTTITVGGASFKVARRARPGQPAVGRPRRRRRDRVDRLLHRRRRRPRRTSTAAPRRSSSPRPAKNEDITVVMGVNDERLRPRGAHDHLQRVLHHELPRADGQGAQRRVRASSRA